MAINKGVLLILSGPSGAGKSTIHKALMKRVDNISYSVSMTTRKPRDGEKDGIDYFFVSEKKFLQEVKKGSFLEYAKVHGNYYGTLKSVVDKDLNNGKDVILEIDIQGALKVKEIAKDGIFIFIMPPTMKDLRDKLVNRDTEDKQKIVERFTNAYKEINEINKYNYIVINDDLESAITKVISILSAEKCRVERIEEFDVNNKEELIHELLVGLR